MKTEAFLQKILSRKKVSAKTSFHFTRNVSYFIFLRALDAYIVDIMEKNPSCSQNFEEETATKTPAPLQIRTLSAQEIIYAKTYARGHAGVHARCLAQSSRALFPKTPKTGFFLTNTNEMWYHKIVTIAQIFIFKCCFLWRCLRHFWSSILASPSTVQGSLGQGLRFQSHPQGTFPAIFLQYNLLGREWVRCYGSSYYKGHWLSVSWK